MVDVVNRIVGFVLGALVVFFIVTQPVAAAALARSIGGSLYRAAENTSTFVLESTGTPASETPAPEPDPRPPGVYGDHGRIEIVPRPDGAGG